MDFSAYEALFNTGDDRALVETFFHEDVRFTGGTRDYRGRDALLAFLKWAHDGVREVMRPQLVLQDADHLFAEIDMDFHATSERADFPFGHLYPGDSVTVKFFVTYRLSNGRIVELKSMTWAPGKGVTTLPRLGGHPSQIAAFHAYVAAFSNADCDRFRQFYAPDVVLTLNPRIPPIHGPQGIVDFYGPMFERVRERLDIHSVEASDSAITLDATMCLTAIADAPDFVMGPMRTGDRIEGRVFVDYALRDGLIARIGVRRQGDMITHRHAAH
ncbi:nuclear transport factor 2 family protein [Sphingomonas canadensis]|uniref:Nuclear transport factor 2 family protein n=1 Tax=Sphingomonas canadensis TaxID=1219257 RepID=A0ABW3HCI6_9SPHN|nr:nuclear transport factor 2 family protein [Sphingomonas canadensis]MCW3837630.1 nuclear transport factor 2 family protein [Sphingomonas canadensis]